MKYILTCLFLFLSLSLFSENPLTKNQKIANSIENKIEMINKETVDLTYISQMLNFLDSKENYSIEQKKTIKILSLLNFEAMTFYDNEDELLKIAKNIFRPSMCGAYFFKDDFLRALNETNQFFIKSEQNINELKLAFQTMEKLFLIEAQKELSKSDVDFEELCRVKKA